MYNEDLKNKFINSISNAHSSSLISKFFNACSDYESSVGMDIFEMSNDDIFEMKRRVSGSIKISNAAMMRIVESYRAFYDSICSAPRQEDVKPSQDAVELNVNVLYNQEQKDRFISDYTASRNTEMSIRSIFKKTFPYEYAESCDVCCMEYELLKKMMDDILTNNDNSVWSYITLIRAYCKWCIKNGIGGANLNINLYKRGSFKDVSCSMFLSPEHLLRYIDAVFGDKYLEKKCIYFRCFAWLVYSGCRISEMSVSNADVSICENGRTVIVAGETFQISPAGYKDMSIASDIILSGCDYEIMRHETYTGTKYKNIAYEFSDRCRTAFKYGRTIMDARYNDIYTSGICYRLYQEEMAHTFCVTKDEVSEPYKRQNNSEYLAWKTSFML